MENINHDIQKDSNNIVIIKGEEIEIEEEDVYEGDHNQDIIIGTPKPCEKLNEIGPTPFLTKTYEMVDDPNTCHIVSWGVTGSTFIVWDPHKFSTDLIPKYFKHSNFSSFIRQLNTYGFRKVHFDRWEFANAGFLKGQKHLLKAIKRRTHGANSNSKLQVIRETTEIENLKKEQQALQGIINDLKQQQQSTDKCLAAMEERMKSAEWKQKKFLLLIAKTMRKTPLFQQLLQTYRQKKALKSGEVSKKRRLAPSESLKDSYPAKTITQNSNQCQKDDSVAIQLEPNLLFNSLDVDVSLGSSQDQKSGLTSDTDSPDLSSGSYIMWEKLIEDDVVCVDDNEEDTLAANETNLVHELQNLIAKPPTWGSLANVAEVACSAGQ